MAATINEVVGTLLLIVLAIIVLLLFAYGLYEYQLVKSYETSVGLNPYCVRQLCTTDGTQTPPYQVPVTQDPERLAYETLTFCVVNAPPCQLLNALNSCTSTSAAPTTEELEQILTFYNQDYYPRCHYNYTFGGSQPQLSPTAPPNTVNTSLACGPNDDFLISLLACSATKQLTDNSDYKALQQQVATLANAEGCPGSTPS